MQMSELYNILKTIGLPITYHHWPTPPSLPYLVYLATDTSNYGADNKVYATIDSYDIELYTAKKDLISETKIQDALNQAELFWDKTELYLDTEKMYQITYSIQI